MTKAAAQAARVAGQAEQMAERAGRILQDAQAKLAQQSFVSQAAAKLDQFAVPGLQAARGTTTRDYIWSVVALLVTLLGVWKHPLLALVLSLVVGAAAVFLGMRTGVSPAARAVAFTLAGALITAAAPADPIELAAVALSVRGAWGIVKELFPAEGPRLAGRRGMQVWGGLTAAAVGLCFQWFKRESSFWSNYNFTDNSITYQFYNWGGQNAASYLVVVIALGLLLYFTQGKRWSFGWQVVLTLLVSSLVMVWVAGLTSYLGFGLLIFTVGIAVALRGLLGDRIAWPKRFR